MSTLKLKFDAALDYQHDAIQSVVGLFEEQPLAQDTYSVTVGQKAGGSQLAMGGSTYSNIPAVANQLVLSEEQLLENLRKVQESNNLPAQASLELTSFTLEEDGITRSVPHFSVEMETGTGMKWSSNSVQRNRFFI